MGVHINIIYILSDTYCLYDICFLLGSYEQCEKKQGFHTCWPLLPEEKFKNLCSLADKQTDNPKIRDDDGNLETSIYKPIIQRNGHFEICLLSPTVSIQNPNVVISCANVNE